MLREGDPGGPPLLTWDHAFRFLSRRLREVGVPPPHRQSRGRVGELVLAVNEAYQLPSGPGVVVEGGYEDGAVDVCPFQGLASFGADDARYYFGRDRVVAELVARLSARLAADGPVLVVGPSGAGKSSLLRAGLRPALDRGLPAAPQARGWPQVMFNPGEDPVRGLARALGHTFGGSLEEIQAALTEDPQSIVGYLRRPGVLAQGQRLVVVVDQFEELFTLCTDERQREVFVAGLVAVSTRGGAVEAPPGVVVLGLRANFYGHCGRFPALAEAMREAQVLVTPMTTRELRDVIEKPTRLAGLSVEPGLVDLLLRDLRAGGPGAGPALPLLSHALLSTWQKRAGRMLTMAGYQAAGGIWDAVARTAEDTHDQLDDDGRTALRRVLLRMVRLGDGAEEDTRRRVLLTEFDEDGPAAPAVLDTLVRARLVTVDTETAEISHDALLRAWPRLRTWIESDRAGLLVRQRLHEAAQAWERDGRDPGALYRGVRLDSAQQWFEESGRTHTTSPEARTFLDASIAQAHIERRTAQRRTRRLRILAATLAILLLASVAGAGTAMWQRQVAADQRDLLASKAAVEAADRIRARDPNLALQLALAARQVADTTEARTSLYDAASTPVDTRLEGHTAGVGQLAYHSGRQILVSIAHDNTVRLWNLSEPNRPRTTAVIPSPTLSHIALSPDGELLAAGHTGTALQLWNIADPDTPVTVASLPIKPSHVTFSSDGRTLFALNKNTLTVWDLTDPEKPVAYSTLSVGLAAVQSIALSADNRTLAAAVKPRDSLKFGLWLWNVTDPRQPVAAATLDTRAATVEFSPRSPLLAVGTTLTGVELWDTTDPTSPTELRRHPRGVIDRVEGLDFSPDGRTLGVGGFESSTSAGSSYVETFDVSEPAEPELIVEYPTPSSITDVVLGDDPGTMFSAGGQSFIQRWQPAPNLVLPKDGSLELDRTIATGSRTLVLPSDRDNGLFTLWRVDGRPWEAQQVGVLNTGREGSLMFLADDHLLVEYHQTAPVRLWDIADPANPVPRASLGRLGRKKEPALYSVHSDVAVSGRTVAVNTDDGQIHLWDVTNPASPVLLTMIPQFNKGGPLYITQDGRTLVVVGGDTVENDINFWDITNPRQPVKGGSLGTSIDSAVGENERFAVIGIVPGETVSLWDVSDLANPVAGSLPYTQARDLGLTDDGRILATATNNSIDLWNIQDVKKPIRVGRIMVTSPDRPRFSSDGRLLAAKSGGERAGQANEEQLHLWDVTDPAHVVKIADLPASNSVFDEFEFEFSSDGNTLYQEIQGEGLRLIDTNIDRFTQRLCEAVDGPLSTDQWQRYFPGTPYNPPCRQ